MYNDKGIKLQAVRIQEEKHFHLNRKIGYFMAESKPELRILVYEEKQMPNVSGRVNKPVGLKSLSVV